jgi:hypothetical protein
MKKLLAILIITFGAWGVFNVNAATISSSSKEVKPSVSVYGDIYEEDTKPYEVETKPVISPSTKPYDIAPYEYDFKITNVSHKSDVKEIIRVEFAYKGAIDLGASKSYVS